LITDSDVTAYDRDGVVCLRRQFDTGWVERLRRAIERDLAAPGPNATNFAGSSAGKFFGDMEGRPGLSRRRPRVPCPGHCRQADAVGIGRFLLRPAIRQGARHRPSDAVAS
jgi:hypothetical protein